MELILDTTYSQFIDYETYPADLKASLERTASYFVKGAQFSEKVRSGKWDGRIYLLNAYGRVPTGLAGVLAKVFKEKGYRLLITDRITYPEPKPWKWVGPELRDYQVEAVDKCLAARRGIVELPTRTGKTYFAGKLIQSLGLRTFYLVTGKESMYQAKKELESWIEGPTFGFYGDGKKDTDADITIGLIQSLNQIKSAKSNPFKNVDVILIDEVHKAASDTNYKFFMGIPAPYRFGMSGTAFRTDNKDVKMIALLGRLIYVKEQEEMWDRGIIERPVVYWLSVGGPSLHRAMHYRHHYRSGIIECTERNRLVGKILEKYEGRQILISVENTAHGEVLEAMYKDAFGVVFVHGKSPKDFREQVFEGLKNNTLKVVIATRIFNESLTFPDLAVLINCAGRKSTLELIQKYGRVQGKGDKSDVAIYDFKDDHSHYLSGHARQRYKELEKRGYEQVEATL